MADYPHLGPEPTLTAVAAEPAQVLEVTTVLRGEVDRFAHDAHDWHIQDGALVILGWDGHEHTAPVAAYSERSGWVLRVRPAAEQGARGSSTLGHRAGQRRLPEHVDPNDAAAVSQWLRDQDGGQ